MFIIKMPFNNPQTISFEEMSKKGGVYKNIYVGDSIRWLVLKDGNVIEISSCNNIFLDFMSNHSDVFNNGFYKVNEQVTILIEEIK